MILLILGASGCAIPIPFLRWHTGFHKRIDAKAVGFIEPGRTTVVEALLRLGSPDEDTGDVLRYWIEEKGAAEAIGLPECWWLPCTVFPVFQSTFYVRYNSDNTVTESGFTEPASVLR